MTLLTFTSESQNMWTEIDKSSYVTYHAFKTASNDTTKTCLVWRVVMFTERIWINLYNIRHKLFGFNSDQQEIISTHG